MAEAISSALCAEVSPALGGARDCCPLPHTPIPASPSSLRFAAEKIFLTKPNTSCTIEMPASLCSEGVRVHPGMPFGFPSESAFGFAGILNLDRSLFPKIVSALNPGGLFVCKMSIHWSTEIASANANFRPLDKNELVSLVPDLQVIDHHERPVRDRGVVEFVGRKPES